MKIIEKNEGTKIEYLQEGSNMISFRDELFLNLAKCERDFPVQIDICENEFGILTTGISRKYIAQIDIPARQYNQIPIETDEGTENEGESFKLEPVPFSMDNITLTLWAIRGKGGNI